MNWKLLRLRAGLSLDKAAARADVTATTARIFELDPLAVRDERKRSALEAVYRALDAAAREGAS